MLPAWSLVAQPVAERSTRTHTPKQPPPPQVDDDQNETISIGEWLDFWKNVLAQDCYTEEDIAEAGELV